MIYLFNGPPGSGKDECANYVANTFGAQQLSFKTALMELTCEHYGVSLDWFLSEYNNRSLKETPYSELGGISKRQALIHISEDIIKPKFGSDYFGVVTAAKIKSDSNYVFSDCGFVDEVNPLINTGEAVTVVQLTRDGYDFSFDSRRYLNAKIEKEYVLGFETEPNEDQYTKEQLNTRAIRIHNNGGLQDLYNCLDRMITEDFNALSTTEEETLLRECLRSGKRA